MNIFTKRLLLLVFLLSGSLQAFAASKALHYDLVVYGATPSGIMTAITAAHGGLNVALLEETPHVGGIITNGLSYTDIGITGVIGGLPHEFFERVGRRYNEAVEYDFEPHVAEQVFNDMLHEAHVTVVMNSRLREVHGVVKRGTSIKQVIMEDGSVFSATIFADCTYDGVLMNEAGVSNTWGREAASQYNEPHAGVLPSQRADLQFRAKVSPYANNGSLLPEVSAAPKGEFGQGDKKIPAYNFRFCFSKDKADQVPYPRPDGYDPARYELLARYLPALAKARGRDLHLDDVFLIGPLQGNKADFNNMGAFSTDYIGANWDYPAASYKRKKQIVDELYKYDAGFLYFLAHDPRVPATLQHEMNDWGLAKDEFTDTKNWPRQMYVREARRMIGEYVFTENDVLVNPIKPDSVGMGSYNLDSHNVQRIPTADGAVENEGDMFVNDKPYEIPYRSIVPMHTEATNLFVTVCLSATHAAYGTLRQEPSYMAVGQAAGDAAVIAVHDHLAVQDVSISKLQAQLLAEQAVLHWHP